MGNGQPSKLNRTNPLRTLWGNCNGRTSEVFKWSLIRHVFRSIKLSNFRGFDDHILPLRPVTIIVGKNNAGKSTIVEALRLISVITRRFQGLNYSELPQWIDRPRRDRGVFPSTEDFEFGNDAVFHRLGDPPAKITAKFSSGEQVEVFIGPLTSAAIWIPLVPRFTLGISFISWDSISLRLRTLGESTWPGVAVQPVEKKQVSATETGFSLFVRDHDFTAEVGWMGHGLQMWLQTMWFLTHCGDASSIILDEPDVYMHADLQRRLIRLLRQRKHQTIIATHSVEIMSEVEPDEILIVDRRRHASAFANNQPEVQSLLFNIGSIHNIQLARLNAAGRFIMVEGDDMDFLKRFQNTLFPESTVPIDTIPHRSIGGWNGWERARGLASLLRDAAPTTITLYCILDSDYHTLKSIDKRLKTAAHEGIQLHVWKRKEIENYLFVPAAICRAIIKASPRITHPTEPEVRQKIEEIVEELRMATLNQIAKEYYEEDRKAGFDGANIQALKRVDASWKDWQRRVSIVSGKEIIHRLAEWANKRFGVSLNAIKIAAELTPAEIDIEIREVISSIEEGVALSKSVGI